jgi:hypothetical protein
MKRPRRLALSLFVLGAPLAGHFGCRAMHPKSPFHGTLSCSCSTAGCNCSHCCGQTTGCDCRGTDAMGDASAVGPPGDAK